MSLAPQATPRPEVSPFWKNPIWWRSVALTYAIALIGGGLANQAGLPLAWMLGPFFACAVVSFAGYVLRPLPFGRQIAQLTIGLGIGLRFTPATLVATFLLAPAML
ncbi:MAG: AbrB family transcriptional regulator, partial [Alphaproteobacteria bacterium]|nr:AbrB family transcriptional regulator [Alphaproteobacteria bacterium]